MRIAVLGVIVGLAAPLPVAAQTATQLGRACHLEAAHGEDAARPADIPGIPLDKIDSRKAIAACEAAMAERPDQAVYAYNLGRAFEATADLKRARELYERAATTGHILAMNALGAMKSLGVGGPTDYVSARHWFETAAAAGNAGAMTNLGFMWQEGLGGPRDYASARQWYEAAAEAGNAPAMFYLAFMSRAGMGSARRADEARWWFAKAAAAGMAEAMVELGGMYATGEGGPRSRKDARYWFAKAAEAGNTTAASRLAQLETPRRSKRAQAVAARSVARAPTPRLVAARRVQRSAPVVPPPRYAARQGVPHAVAYRDAPPVRSAFGRAVRICVLPNGMTFYCY